MDQQTEFFFPKEHQPGLFRSDPWLKAWLRSWGDHESIIETLLPNRNDDIVNLSDVFLKTKVNRKKIFPIVCASPLGTPNLNLRSIRSEYFFIPQDEASEIDSVSAYLDTALQSNWDELIIPDILKSSRTYNSIIKAAIQRNLWPRQLKIESTYAIDLRQRDFSAYISNLSKSSRLKLYNRRKTLALLGEVSIENIWPQREKFYDLLNSFHQKRWGKNCFRDRNLILIDTLLDELSGLDDAIDFSVLKVDGHVVSVIFDIRFQQRQYNIQSGYLEGFDKRISLGTLHFGYQIEKAFSNNHIDFYDFMAGSGKNADYKKSLASNQDQLVSLLLVRNPLLKFVYKFQRQIQRPS